MNIKEFKTWLDKFPDEAIVEVYVQEKAPEYQSYGEAVAREFTGDEYEDYEYIDFTGNRYVKAGHPCFGKKILMLGMGD